MDFAAHIVGVALFFGVRAVDRVRGNALTLQELHGLLQSFAMTVRPQNDAVSISLQHFQSLDGEGHGLAYGRVPIHHHGAIEVDCDEQALFHHPCGWSARSSFSSRSVAFPSNPRVLNVNMRPGS